MSVCVKLCQTGVQGFSFFSDLLVLKKRKKKQLFIFYWNIAE